MAFESFQAEVNQGTWLVHRIMRYNILYHCNVFLILLPTGSQIFDIRFRMCNYQGLAKWAVNNYSAFEYSNKVGNNC
jgi:hypothetical protein